MDKEKFFSLWQYLLDNPTCNCNSKEKFSELLVLSSSNVNVGKLLLTELLSLIRQNQRNTEILKKINSYLNSINIIINQ